MSHPVSILNVGLMISDTPNGFQRPMREIAGNGYWELKSSAPNFNYELKELVRQHNPDIVFIQLQQEGILDPQTAYDISRKSFVINWTGDVRSHTPPWFFTVGRNIQLTTFSNMVDVKNCLSQDIKADYLEIGIDPDIYKYRNLVKRDDLQIVAMFNDYNAQFPLSGYRRDLVRALKDHFGSRFSVFGVGWGSTGSGNLNGSQLDESITYNQAKIAINCSHFDYERYSSDRLLRILGSHTFCLSHNFTGIEQDYQIGKHLDVFNTIPEMIDKCNFYLANESLREEIAMNGGKHCHENFTFANMAENIVQLYYKHRVLAAH